MLSNHTRKNRVDRLRLVLADLRQQALSLNTNQPPPVPDPDAATPDQVKYLLSLYRQLGQQTFSVAKWNLGIIRKVPEMSRTEAARLINHLIGIGGPAA